LILAEAFFLLEYEQTNTKTDKFTNADDHPTMPQLSCAW